MTISKIVRGHLRAWVIEKAGERRSWLKLGVKGSQGLAREIIEYYWMKDDAPFVKARSTAKQS